jgi:enoyl-CoA hydratase
MIEVGREDGIATLVMDRGRGNALDTEFLAALAHEFEALREDLPRGVVLGARGKIFCAGLDLRALANADAERLTEVIEGLHRTCRVIFGFPRPVVAAMNGHAVAGGALLSLACDLRLMVMGEARWGLTESTLGLVVPASLIEMARYSVDRTVLEKLLYGGQAYPAFKAREMGVIDDLVEADDLAARAREAIEAWTPVEAAFGDIKIRLKAPALESMDSARSRDLEFLEQWFSPGVRQRVQAAVDKLGGGRGHRS